MIDLSIMADLEAIAPQDQQRCKVAILNKSRDLLAYFADAEWHDQAGDWIAMDLWIGGRSSALDLAAAQALTFLWEPCDRP